MDSEEEKQELGADGRPSGVEMETDSIPFEPFDPASISIEPKGLQMDHLLRRLRQGSIRLAPAFQRKFVWDQERSSLLIESLMLRIPLPMFYVAANEDGTWDVVDGLQRLTTIRNFLLGEEIDSKGEKLIEEAVPFELKKLEFWGDHFNGMTFSKLVESATHARIVNNIMETELRFTVINPATPDEVKRNIFKRINTGGMPLTLQEIRHALYQGHSTKLLQEMVEFSEFKEAVGRNIDDSRMAARELALRFLAFYIHDTDQYEGNMDKFLSDTMRLINSAPEFDTDKLKKIFRNRPNFRFHKFNKNELIEKFKLGMQRSMEFFDEYAFRKAVPSSRRPPINKALFETWANIFAKMTDNDYQTLLTFKVKFFDEYRSLLNTNDFERAVSRDSSTISGTKERYVKINSLIDKFLGAAP